MTYDRFMEMPGMEFLARAIRDHVDRRAAYSGKWEQGLQGPDVHPTLEPGEAKKGYRDYWEMNQTRAGRCEQIYDEKMSKGAKHLVDTSKEIYAELGLVGGEGVKIKNTGTSR
jgi:hypothetical protein